MSNTQVKHSTEFNPSDVVFSSIRKNRMGGKSVYLTGNAGRKLYIQLPTMKAPFGLSEYEDKASGRKSYSLDLSLDTSDEKVKDLHTKLQGLDEKVIDVVHQNSGAWLGKKYTKEMMQEVMYKPIIKEPSNPQYSSTIKLKILTDSSGDFVPDGFDSDRNPIDLASVTGGDRVGAIMEICSIWFIDTKFGVTVRLTQLRTEPSSKITGFAFLDEPGEATATSAVVETEEEEYEEVTDDGEEDFVDEAVM